MRILYTMFFFWGIFWFERCETSNIRILGSAITEIEKEGIMDFGTRAFQNYPTKQRSSIAKPW